MCSRVLGCRQIIFEEGEASTWDYVQKIKNNLKHIFTEFHQFTTYCFWDNLFQSEISQ